MEPAPNPELPQKPLPEAKPIQSPKKDQPEKKPMSAPGTPRRTLEDIASGKSVAEATKPPENLPSREMVTALLNEANVLLLDMKDLRLWTSALATQAADTPLGNEVRMSALKSVSTMKTEGLPTEQVHQVEELQAKIKALNLPETKPEDSAVLGIIENFNASHPDKAIPQAVIDKIKAGDIKSSEAVAELLQTNPDLGQETWKQLTGIEGFTGLTPSPEAMLDLAGIPKSPENLTKAKEIFGFVAQIKEPSHFWENFATNAMYFTLFLQFFTSVALGEGGGGHH